MYRGRATVEYKIFDHTGDAGIVSKRLKKNVEAITGKHSIASLQRTATPQASYTIRNVLRSAS